MSTQLRGQHPCPYKNKHLAVYPVLFLLVNMNSTILILVLALVGAIVAEGYKYPTNVISRTPCDMEPAGCPLHRNRNVICLHECWMTSDDPPRTECSNKYYMQVGCFAY